MIDTLAKKKTCNFICIYICNSMCNSKWNAKSKAIYRVLTWNFYLELHIALQLEVHMALLLVLYC